MIQVYDKKNTSFTKPKFIFTRVTDLRVSTVLSAEETMEFVVPLNMIPTVIQTEDFVSFNNRNYIIKRMSVVRDDSGKYVRIECVGLYEMLLDTIIEGEDTWLAGYSMQAALERVLRGTMFSIGRVDNFETWDIELAEKNAIEAINDIQSTWPGKAEIFFEGFKLYALAMRGSETNVQIRYKKNLDTIQKITDSNDLVTRLKGRGKDGLTVEGYDVTNLSEDDYKGFSTKVVGGKTVIDKDYVDAPTINDYAIPKAAIMDWTELDNQEALFKKMKEYILQVYKPRVSYEVRFVELSRQGISFTDVNIGDWVWIHDEDLGVTDKVRVVELDKDPLNMDMSTAILASRHMTIVDFLSELQDTKNLVDEIGQGLQGRFNELEKAIDDATKIINAGGSTVVISRDDGIIVIDDETLSPPGKGGAIVNTTKLLKIANGAIGCSVDGGISYRNAMTGDGINADLITAGTVKAGYIQVGSASQFEPGFSPNDVRQIVYEEMQNTKDSVNNRIFPLEAETVALNTSLNQTMTAQNMLRKDLQDKIDILNTDVSGLSGSTEGLNSLYQGINDLMLNKKNFFYWDTSGLRGIDASNPAYQMLLSSTGLGLSRDGGLTYTNAITAKGIMASQVNIGTFGAEPFKGLVIHNGSGAESLAIDTNGNLSMMGNINMTGGSIAWNQVSRIPYDALDESMKGKFTYIDSDGIYTGTVQANQLNAKGLAISNSKGVTFSVDTNGNVVVKGTIHMDSNSTIQWNSSNAPDASMVGARPDNWMPTQNELGGWTTYISSTGLYTGTVGANKILIGGANGYISFDDLANKPTATSLGAATTSQLNAVSNSVTNLQGNVSSLDQKYNREIANTRSDLLSRINSIDSISESTVTYIAKNEIRTATIRANQITAGTLSGIRVEGITGYFDDTVTIGSGRMGYGRRKISFDYNSEIVYENRGSGGYDMVIRSADDLTLWGAGQLKMHNHPRDVWFSKRGNSGDGPASNYFTMQDIVDAISRLGGKVY